MENIPFLIGFHTSQVVIARFLNHQQYFCPKFFPRWIPWGFNGGNRPNCHHWGPQDGEASALLALALTTAEPKVALGGIMKKGWEDASRKSNPGEGVDHKVILVILFLFEVGVPLTLPETNSLHLKIDGWKVGRPIFRCYVSFWGCISPGLLLSPSDDPRKGVRTLNQPSTIE